MDFAFSPMRADLESSMQERNTPDEMDVDPTATEEAMNTPTRTESFANIVVERDREALEVFGPSVQFLVAPQPSDEAPCVMKGTIPPGVSVPIHSHPGIKAFFVLSGDVEVFSDKGERLIGSRLVLGIS